MKISTTNQTIASVEIRSPIRAPFVSGLKAGLPIAVGYIPIAIAFGLVAKSAGVPAYIAALMSLFVYAGASQFVAVNLLVLGTAGWEIVLTTFILNLRQFLMAATMSQRMPQGLSRLWMAILAYGITDETFTVGTLREEQTLHPHFVLGLNLIAWSAWNIGTWVGVFLTAGLPTMLQASMGIALYAMFIGILIPALKTSRPALWICLLAVGIHSLLHWAPPTQGLSVGWDIVITTVVSCLVGAMVFPERGENE